MPSRVFSHQLRHGFTLIELLIVIAIVAVLAVGVLLTLNPAELLRQARDTTRLSELTTLNKAIGLFQTRSSPELGTSSVVYVSLPDSSATCANLDLPTLPSGWTYACATAANLRNIDGTGWVPINFTSLSVGSPLSALPIDPVNTTTNGSFYTYVTTNATWEVTSALEASRNALIASGDGGSSLASLERGTSLSLTPQAIEESKRDSSLIAYWAFEESSGLTAQDWGRSNFSGTLTAGITRHTGSTCRFTGCIYLNGTSDQVTVLNTSGRLQPPADNSFNIWFKIGATHDAYDTLFGFGPAGNIFDARLDSLTISLASIETDAGNQYLYRSGLPNLQDGNWHMYTKVISKSGGYARMYLDGVLRAERLDMATSTLDSYNALTFGIGSAYNHRYLNGYIDELRAYNRALSLAEIQSLYVSGL